MKICTRLIQQILFLTLLFVTSISWSQKLDLELFKNIEPRNIGPAGMSGRVTAIDVVTEQPEIIYAGTASGGVWKSTSGGMKWDPIFDNEKTASVGALAIQQSNPSVIWVGTGEGNPRNSLNGGYGIYKSLDAGRTWTCMGLEETRHIHRVIIDPTNPDIVYAAAIGSPWGEHEERGIYKTTDGGKNWKRILFTNQRSGAADLVMDPTNPNKLIAAMWEHKREPWFFNSGGPGSGLFMTHDGGNTWKQLTHDDGLPEGDLGRIGLAIAPSEPNIIYALVESKKNALYKSTDGGFNWKKINDKSDIGNRPFYYSDIFVDPQNENRIYSVFTYVNVSEDGGKSFDQLMPAYGVSNGVHPDHHAWYIHPENGKFLIDGNDGGLNISKDRGKTWRFIGNLPVAQFYHINVDNDIPYNVYGGMQDNGSWRGPSYVWRSQGIRNSYWQEISFGDGFDVIPDPENSRYGYTMSQQGYVSRYDWQTGNNHTIRPTAKAPFTKLRFNWNAAINIDPFDHSTLYFGSQFVHKSTDKGLNWEIISPDLTTNDPNKQNQSESGGLTIDATGAENHTTILVIEPSPVEKDVLYVGTDDGLVHITKDGGKNWENITNGLKGLPEGSWIVQIKASKTKKGHALLVANDYRRFNYSAYAYRTTNYGKTWKRIVNDNDTQSYALSIIEHPKENNLMFLGTDDGLYVSINAGKEWTKYTNGFPTVSVKDLVIQERENDLVIGTFGRAAWVLDDLEPFIAFAKAKQKQPIELYTPPTAYLANYQQPTGSRFGADAMYHGENRGSSGRFRFYLDPEYQAQDSTATDSITLTIKDGKEVIRTLKRKTPKEHGIHQWDWSLRKKGVPYPSKKVYKEKIEPRGFSVAPGTYTATITYGDVESSTTIKVAADPRLEPVNEMDNAMQMAALDRLEQLQLQIHKKTQDIAQKIDYIEEIVPIIEREKNDDYKELLDKASAIKEQLEEFQELYFGKVDKRQGITRNAEPTVLNALNLARQYATRREGSISQTSNELIDLAFNKSVEAQMEIDKFLSENWSVFQAELESVKVNLKAKK